MSAERFDMRNTMEQRAIARTRGSSVLRMRLVGIGWNQLAIRRELGFDLKTIRNG